MENQQVKNLILKARSSGFTLVETQQPTEITDEMIEIRDLPLSEWHLVEPAFHSMGSLLPDPSLAVIRVAVLKLEGQEEKIMGFQVTQKVLMAQPSLVYPEFQHLKVLEKLYADLDSQLFPGMFYLVTIEDPALIRKAEHNGFVQVPGSLMIKLKE